MSDLRSRLPAHSLMQRTLELHPPGFHTPSGEALSWYKGALGEIAVAGVLAQLGHEWTVLHSVPVGRASTDIDHVVVGPSGVFTINTKSHPRQDVWIGGHGLLVSGQRTNYIGLAAKEAARAEVLLSKATGLTVPVIPLLVLVNPGKRTVKAEPEGGVRVVADWELLAALQGRAIFSGEQAARIIAAAVRPGTWHENPTPVDDGRAVAIQFNAIIARALQGAPPAPDPVAAPSVVLAPNSRTAGQRQPTASPARSSPSPAPRRRTRKRQAGAGEALAKVLAIGFGIWILYGSVVPALQNALGN